jgi:undecaprenyl-diphosphatase
MSKSAAIAWCVCLLALVGFVGGAIRASSGEVLPLDVSVARDVQSLPGWLAAFFDFENWLGDTVPLAIVTFVAAAVLLQRRRSLEAVLMLASFLPRIGDVLVKRIVDEPRPSSDLVSVRFPHDELSFPSGHVIGVTLVFGMLAMFAPAMTQSRAVSRCIQAACLLFVLTIWLARVWVGAHWPSDTLGGYVYAAMFLIPVAVVYRGRVAQSGGAAEPGRAPF